MLHVLVVNAQLKKIYDCNKVKFYHFKDKIFKEILSHYGNYLIF